MLNEGQAGVTTGATGPGEAARLGVPGSAAPSQVSMTQAYAGAAMVLGALLVAYAVKKKVLQKKAAQPQRGPLAQAGVDAELIRDMRELSDRLATDLDQKAARLEQLIAMADERVGNLLSAVRAQPRMESRVVEVKPEARRPSPRTDAYEAMHRDVYELADIGLSVIEIASKLDRPTGQVELILNLRKGTVAL